MLVISEISREGVKENLSRIRIEYSRTVEKITSITQEASKDPATPSPTGTIVHDPNGLGINASYGFSETAGVQSSMIRYTELLKILAEYLTSLGYWIEFLHTVWETLGLFEALTMIILVFFGLKKGFKLQV